MPPKRLFILLPCNDLEELSLRRAAPEAEQLLAAWSALWHPALLAGCEVLPAWAPAELPPPGPADCLIVIPPLCASRVPAEWLAAAKEAGACLIQDCTSRAAILDVALRAAGWAGHLSDQPEAVADFLAFGVGHFLVELLTHQRRYTSGLDAATLETRALVAARALLAGDSAAAQDGLQAAFDLLNQARDYSSFAETHLLDLTLVAPSTMGPALRAELDRAAPINLLVAGEVIAAMARNEPATLEAIRRGLDAGTVTIIGGEWTEAELPLLPPEAIAYQLRKGLAAYEEHLGRRPAIFGRRRFGLTPALPQLLLEQGFVGGLHFTLDDGTFPAGNQSRIRWQGLDSSALEMLARIPLDAGDAAAFLRLPEKLGEALDLDHVATMVFAHWPGLASPWYDDLKRIARRSGALGRFEPLLEYFQATEYAGQTADYAADRYHSPYLRQEVGEGRRNPLSRWAGYYYNRAAAETLQTLYTLNVLLGAPLETPSPGQRLLDELDDAIAAPVQAGSQPSALKSLPAALNSQLATLNARIFVAGRSASPDEGCLVVNPWTLAADVRAESFAPEKGDITAENGDITDFSFSAATVGKRLPEKSVMSPFSSSWPSGGVEVPGMGFAWIGPGSAASDKPAEPQRWWRRKRPADPPLAEENVVRNEFFEVILSPTTGAIQSVSDYQTRGNRLSQQIALRLPRTAPVRRDAWGNSVEDPNFAYSLMAADEVAVTASGTDVGEITSRGRLVDRDGRLLARFVQRTRAHRGSRILVLEIELDAEQLPEPDPWKSYYAVRWAWDDETAAMYRGVNMASCPTDVVEIESPHFVEMRWGAKRTTILAGGLPYHRRRGRMLDTLLGVGREVLPWARLGVGFDLAHPMAAALGFLAPPLALPGVTAPATPSGWFFHLDVKNVVAMHWEPLAAEGRVEGVRVRLLETEGRRTTAHLRSFRAVGSAQQIGPGNEPPTALPVEGDRITAELGPYQAITLECVLT